MRGKSWSRESWNKYVSNSIRLASYAENATQGEDIKEGEEAGHSKGTRCRSRRRCRKWSPHPSQSSSTIRTRWHLRRGGRSPSRNYTPARSSLRRCTKPTLGVCKVTMSERSWDTWSLYASTVAHSTLLRPLGPHHRHFRPTFSQLKSVRILCCFFANILMTRL